MTLSRTSAGAPAYGRNLILALAAIMTIGPAKAGAGDRESRNADLVRAAFTAWERGDGTVFDLLAPDIAWTIHGSGPVAGTYRGVDAFLERASAPLVSRLATPLVPRVHHIWAEGERVIIRFDASATTTSGAAYENQFVWIFRLEDSAVVEAEAFLDLVAYREVVEDNEPRAEETEMKTDHPYVGMWVTRDGNIRHELLPNGRYIEARGTRERAYEGRYEVTGDRIEYWDDSGFTADVDFVDDVLHHGGMILYRRPL